MKDFKKLIVWQKSMLLVKELYNLVSFLPNEEKYGLRSQMTRAAVSIPSNIAEGCSRHTEREFKRFLEIALGSAFELETQLLLTQELKFRDIDFKIIVERTCEIQKMLQGLMKKIQC